MKMKAYETSATLYQSTPRDMLNIFNKSNISLLGVQPNSAVVVMFTAMGKFVQMN
jgi:hypothetical protein